MNERTRLNSAIIQTFAALNHIAKELRGANPAWDRERTADTLEQLATTLREEFKKNLMEEAK